MIQLTALVSGTVQGVAYRVYVQDAASELGLVGYVKNLADGRVEILAQGLPDDLKALVEYLHEGSLRSRVESVAVEWQSARTRYDDFSILHEPY